jgi:diguanylate cyclase (GGDEF)-like protein/PAS domain S-box-containing protein
MTQTLWGTWAIASTPPGVDGSADVLASRTKKVKTAHDMCSKDDSGPVGGRTVVVDGAGQIQSVDRAVAELFGFAPDELTGRAVADLVDAAVGDAVQRRAVEEALLRSESRLAEAQELARLGSWEWDVTANVVSWSDELFRIYGVEPQTFVPSYEEFIARVHPDDRASVDARNHKAFANHQPFEDVKRVVRPDGSVFLMRTQGEVVCGADGNPLRLLGVCEDVTAQVRAREAEVTLAAIVSSSNDAIYTVDAHGAIASWNRAAERLFGYTEPEAMGMPIARLLPPDAVELYAHMVRRAIAGEVVTPWQATLLRCDGELVEASLSMSPMGAVSGGDLGVSVIARDTTERRRFEATLRRLSDHDSLTGLYNRRRFDEELARAVASAPRYAETSALLLVNIDDFTFVNDTLGHGAGDELLLSIAGVIRGRVRETDVLARIGGDEFAILLPRADAGDAQRLAVDLLQAVRDHETELGGNPVRSTVSIGAIAFDASYDSAEDVLRAVDRAVHDAKHHGRDRCVLGSRIGGAALPSVSWDARIRDALANDRFVLHCQPIQAIGVEHVDRYELLLRLRDPDGTLVAPGEFLGVAERLGLIHAIDRWVAGQAIALLVEHPELTFEVNVSGASMDDEALLELVCGELGRTQVDPARLTFEITETATVAHVEGVRHFAESLAALGCRFAIDDFGTGFGSFFYLKHLPVAYLKIDGEFVRTPRSRADELVIEAIVGMARGLGKQTIAEFVGDDETVKMLARAGVDFAQGYHVGRPFSVDELPRAG